MLKLNFNISYYDLIDDNLALGNRQILFDQNPYTNELPRKFHEILKANIRKTVPCVINNKLALVLYLNNSLEKATSQFSKASFGSISNLYYQYLLKLRKCDLLYDGDYRNMVNKIYKLIN